MRRLDLHLRAIELFVALIVLNAGLLALMSAFQSGSLGRAHRAHAAVPVAPARRVSSTLRALDR